MTDKYVKNYNNGNREIEVVFVSSTCLNEEEMAEDEEEEDDDDEFDFNPNSLSTKQPRKRMVTMRLLPSGQEVLVKCRLPWTWSWLQATLRLNYPPSQRFGAVQQMVENMFTVLEYRLSPSRGREGRSVINMFMNDVISNNTGTEKLNRESEGETMQREKDNFNRYLGQQSDSQVYLGGSFLS